MNTTPTVPDSLSTPTYWADALTPMPASQGRPWLARLRQKCSDWAFLEAQSRAESALWDLGQGDRRVMAELMLARKREDSADNAPMVAMSEMPEADTVASVVPKTSALLGLGWARVIEDAYQTRNARWRYA